MNIILKTFQKYFETRKFLVAGVVLAGGVSSRMGKDKALLQHKGKSLLQYQFEKVKQVVGEGSVYVSGGYRDYPFIADVIENQGPLGGFYSSLQRLSSYKWILFVPVDMPTLNFNILRDLINSANFDQSYECVHYEGFELPMLLANTPKISELVLKKINHSINNKKSIRSLIEVLNKKMLTPSAKLIPLFLNMNTPVEWESLARGNKN